MSNFDWQTEEEAEAIWEAATEAIPVQPRRLSPRLRRWLVAGLGTLLLLAGLGYWQVQRRVSVATQTVEANLLATHRLLQQVAAAGDEELFRGMISGRNMGWAEVQTGLMKEGQWLARPAFRFFHAPEAVPADQPTVTLAPDLAQAEVLFAEPYLGLDGARGVLGQTAVYRQGNDNRWLLAEPDADFWGAWQTIGGKTITLTFPQRDQAVAERLLADLEADVARACGIMNKTTNSSSPCPADLALALTFSTRAELLQRGESRRPVLLAGLELELPTPTLVGVPLNEAGYGLLRQGYGGQVVTAVLAHLVDYTCCLKQHFFSALLDRQLSQLGVQPWPLTAAEYDQLLLNPHDLDQVAAAWQSGLIRSSDWRIVYAAMEFLLTEIVPDGDMVAWQQAISQQNHEDELARLISSKQLTRLWRDDWLRFIYRHSASGQVAMAAWPKTVVYQCNTLTHTVAQAFDFATQQWQEIYRLPSPDNGYFFTENELAPLPDESGFLIEQRQNETQELIGNLLIGRNGATFMLLTLSVDILIDYPGYYFTGETDPTQQYMVIATRKNSRLPTRHFVLDLHNCDGARCELAERPFWFTWSPDGTRSLLAGPEPRLAAGLDVALRSWERPLLLGDALGQPVRELATGSEPFWIDNDRYGTIRVTEERQLAFAVVDVDSGAVERLVTAAEVAALLPNAPESLVILAAQPFPHDSTQILLEVRDGLAEAGTTTLLVLRLDGTGEPLRRLYQSSRLLQYEMAPNGRWLTVRWQKGAAGRVWLVNVDTGAVTMLGAEKVHWLENGRWLLREFNTHSLLTDPETGYQSLLLPPSPNCSYIG